MRLLHTGDWHLNRKYPYFDQNCRERLEESLWQFAAELLLQAEAWQVDVLLLAGDTVDDTKDGAVAYDRLARLLEGAPCPVILLPGNHDPYVPGGFWDQVRWPKHVKLLRDEEPVRVSGEVFVHGYPWQRRFMGRPLAAARPAFSGGRHILLHHGDVYRGSYRPLGEASAYDYVALGHIHQPKHLTAQMAYSGGPWALHGGETGLKGVFLLDVGERVKASFQPLQYRLAHRLRPGEELPRLTEVSWDFYRGMAVAGEAWEQWKIKAPLAVAELFPVWDEVNAAIIEEVQALSEDDRVTEAILRALKAVTPCI